jgi:hypothetical protein
MSDLEQPLLPPAEPAESQPWWAGAGPVVPPAGEGDADTSCVAEPEAAEAAGAASDGGAGAPLVQIRAGGPAAAAVANLSNTSARALARSARVRLTASSAHASCAVHA